MPTARLERLARPTDRPVPRPKHYTVADLEGLGEVRSPRYEIIDGELFLSPSPHRHHQRIIGRLFRILAPWIEARDLGELFVSPVDVEFAEDRVVIPDLVFVRKAKRGAMEAADGGSITVVPDLVVEVLSPSTKRYDRTDKLRLYEGEGVEEVWIVDPRQQIVEGHRLGDGGYGPPVTAGVGEALRSVVLEGCEIEAAELFAAP